MERLFGWARILDDGSPAPGATITVYNAGTLVPASIFADNIGTVKANPYSADASTAYWFHYAANGRYDVKFSGGGIATPYTLADVLVLDTAAGGYIQTLNAQGQATQTMVAGSAGTDFAVNSAGGIHTFNLPNAGAAARGVVSIGAQTFAGAKSFSTPIGVVSGGLGVATVPTNGQIPIGNGTGYTIAELSEGGSILITPGPGTITIDTTQDITTLGGPQFSSIILSGAVNPITFSDFISGNGGGLAISPSGFGNPVIMLDGQLLIGDTGGAPVAALPIAGAGISIAGGAGTLTIANTGVTSLNALTGPLALTVGSSGTDAAWGLVAAGASTLPLNLPSASPTARGLITTGAQTLAGVKTFNNPPQAIPGSGASSVTPGRLVVGFKNDGTLVANSLGVETNLNVVTLDANTLDTDNLSRLIVRAWGIVAANANSKNIRLYFGASVICQLNHATNLNNMAWYVEALVKRVAVGNQEAIGHGQASGLSSTTIGIIDTRRTNPAESLIAAVTIKTTGQGVANSDIIGTGLDVEVLY